CVSQGAYLCTGNHDWSDPAFGLIVKPITLGDGSWVGARAVIAPGVELGECAVAAAGSVVARPIPPYEVHSGNPASFRCVRHFVTMDGVAPETPTDRSFTSGLPSVGPGAPSSRRRSRAL